MADAVTVGEASRGPQSTNYSCKLVENYRCGPQCYIQATANVDSSANEPRLRDIFSSQHISPGAVIKHGLASVSSRFSFFSQKKARRLAESALISDRLGLTLKAGMRSLEKAPSTMSSPRPSGNGTSGTTWSSSI